MKKVLVAYATRAGSTQEVAEAIGRELGVKGCDVNVARVQHVKDVTGYDLIVVGTAARMSKVYSEAVDFLKKHARNFGQAQVAYFYSGAVLNVDTPERRKQALDSLEPMVQIRKPALIGLFGGNVDPARLSGFWKFAISRIKEGEMAPGDYRDWDAIQSWADELAALPDVPV